MGDYFIGKLFARDRAMYASVKGPDTGTSTAKGPEEESAIARKNYDAYIRSRDAGHSDWVKIATQCDSYFIGEQWEKTTTDQLDAEGRPHVTINQVLSTVNSMLSEHVRTRQEISFSPRAHGATDDVAKALAFVEKQVQYNNESAWVEQQVVADGFIEDRGYFDVRISFEDNIFGEVREIALDPRDVFLDPGAKEYDPRTWKEVIRSRWLTPDEIAVNYGEDKAERIKYKTTANRYSTDSIEFENTSRTFGDDEQATYISTEDDARTVRRARLIERQWKQYTRCKYFVDPVEGDMVRVPEGWDELRVASHAAAYDLELFEKPELRIRWTTSVDDVLLYDDWSLYNRFTVIPFFPYFRRGKPSGLVRHLLSPQDMLNKITSQELHVVNTTANSGWIFESGSLVNMDADDLELVGAKTGLVLEFKKGSTPPEKIQPNAIPTGLDNIATKAQIYFRNVSGLPETFVSGQSQREVSGVAIDKMNQSGSSSMDIVWDNLAKTRQWRAEFHLELIQQWYSERRLISLTELDEDGTPQTQELAVNEETPEGHILNNLSLGEYEVIVISQPERAATMDQEFAQVMEMRSAGIMIPDWVAVQASRLTNKNEVAEVMKKIQGMADPTPEEVQRQMLMDQLQLQGAQATVAGLIADAKLKEAQAELALAKADAAMKQPLIDMQKEGAKMRLALEALQADLQKSAAELQTRIVVSREKNDATRYAAQVDSMTRRVGSLVKRQTDLAGLAVKARADRNKPKPAKK